MADSNFIKNCNSCIYFSDPNMIMGNCRRYPSYQNRHGTEWCGEYQQNPGLMVMNHLIEDVSRQSIMAEVATIKPKSGRPKKNA